MEPVFRLQQTSVADEMLTFLEEAAFEIEQFGRAMEAMGIALNLQKEEDVIVATGVGATSVLAGLGQARRQELFAGVQRRR